MHEVNIREIRADLGGFTLVVDAFVSSRGLHHIEGQNGSGKSTFLRILLGTLVPLVGEVTRANQDSAIGYIPQQYRMATFPWLTARDNLHVFGHLAPAEAWLRRLGFAGSDLKKRPPQLSGGQCQRLVLVRELLRKPDLLVADEPFSSLDTGAIEAASELFGEILDSGSAIVLTSHIPLPNLLRERAKRYTVRRTEESISTLTTVVF